MEAKLLVTSVMRKHEVWYVVSVLYADVVQMFGIESIYIYTALLLKRRVIVYAPDVATVQKVTR